MSLDLTFGNTILPILKLFCQIRCFILNMINSGFDLFQFSFIYLFLDNISCKVPISLTLLSLKYKTKTLYELSKFEVFAFPIKKKTEKNYLHCFFLYAFNGHRPHFIVLYCCTSILKGTRLVASLEPIGPTMTCQRGPTIQILNWWTTYSFLLFIFHARNGKENSTNLRAKPHLTTPLVPFLRSFSFRKHEEKLHLLFYFLTSFPPFDVSCIYCMQITFLLPSTQQAPPSNHYVKGERT
jgi:hypothetical protein